MKFYAWSAPQLSAPSTTGAKLDPGGPIARSRRISRSNRPFS